MASVRRVAAKKREYPNGNLQAYSPAICRLVEPMLSMAEEKSIPQTVGQAFSARDRLLTPADRDSFMRKPERKAVIEAHMTLGLHIRNAWFRSARTPLNGYLREKGARSFDDASTLLLTAYWRHLNGLPTDLD